MQNRYVGDIGDFTKYALLRCLSEGLRLGVAWYLYPDEDHNSDGKHTRYLDQPDRWAQYDPELFGVLRDLVATGSRNIDAIEGAGILPRAVFASDVLRFDGHWQDRAAWRGRWFERVQGGLASADIVFADPDNGLCADERFRSSRAKDNKRMPLSEAIALAEGRCAVIYHHNSRFKGGHAAEVQHWLAQLPTGSVALRARSRSPRTFFVVTPTTGILQRARSFAQAWPDIELHEADQRPDQQSPTEHRESDSWEAEERR